ncbi:MAG: 3-hydroxyisobutyrate dehydrogenase [Deltaproteobacteria bacterium]|jgi:3-hydroxyisobutyrate dehydrogenase|nr:MAG: 3-hydroxyisobutyrate dehydrogenase [Deltaproteobacteria bacterium]
MIIVFIISDRQSNYQRLTITNLFVNKVIAFALDNLQEKEKMATENINPLNTRIGWIGTGVMGASMCLHIVKRGYKTFVFNRTKEKARELLEVGAIWVESPKEVAESADIIFTMVGFPSDVEEVYFGEKGILKGVKPSAILIDMTTTKPSLAIEIYNAAKSKGASFIDAPVSGGDVGAKNATLSIMVGGDKDVVERVMPLLELLGKKIVYQGRAGSGQHTKMCNQIVVTGNMIGMCESLLYAYKSGLNIETVLSSISEGAASSWLLNNLTPRIVKGDFNPGFFVEHFIKDMEIALEEASRMNLCLPGLALVHQLYLATKAQGYGRLGTQALILALDSISKAGIFSKGN